MFAKQKSYSPLRAGVLLIVIALLLTGVPLAGGQNDVHAATEGGFKYTITNDIYGYGAYVTKYSGGTDIIVPKTLGGQNVVSVDLSSMGITSLDVSAAVALKIWIAMTTN
ncbi:MAG: hypothetical protein LBT52_05785 [Clostridiales Family XIII bacterium]|nr:hypothetical protein [Clostridiales Family XIII bacterium]